MATIQITLSEINTLRTLNEASVGRLSEPTSFYKKPKNERQGGKQVRFHKMNF